MSTIIDFKLIANANFAPVYSELAKIRASMASLSQSTVTSGITKGMTAGLKAAEEQMLRNISGVKGFQTETVKLSSATDRLTKSLVQSKFTLGQYMSMWGKQKSIIPELNAIAEAQSRVAQSMVVPSATRQGMAHVITAMNGMKNATLQTKIYQQALNTALRDGATSLINFGKNTQWAGRQLTAGFTMPLTIAAGLISKMFYDVDKNLTRLSRVYGAGLAKPTEETIRNIKKQIMDVSKELSKTLGISAKEVTDTAAELAAAGLSGKTLVEATRQASRIVVLGETDKQEAVKATIALQTAYRLNTEELTESVNFFNAAQAATSTNMQDLIEAVPRVGPVVKGLGGTYKDMVALLTAMKEGGVPAGEAANAIKNSLARIINPTEAAQKRLKSFGIDIKEIVAKNAGNLTGTIVSLQSQLDNLSSTQRQQAIAELFGKFQFARMVALMDNFGKVGTQSAKVIQMMGLSARDLAKIADEQTKKIQQSASGKFKIAIESIKTELIPIGEQFLKVFTFIIDKVDSVIKFFNKLGPMKNIILSILGGAAIVGPITMVIGLFANLAGQILKSVNNIRMFKQGFMSAIGQGPIAGIMAGLKGLNNYFIQIDKAQLASKALSGEVHGLVVREEQAIASLTKAIAMYRTEVERLIATQSGVRVAGNVPFFPTSAPTTSGQIIGATGRYSSPLVTPISSAMRSRQGFESEGRFVEMMHYSPYMDTARGTDVLGQGGNWQERNALGSAAIFPAIMARQGSDIQALNQIYGSKQTPTLSPRMMTPQNLQAVMAAMNIPLNAANITAAQKAFSLETIASHETGRMGSLLAMQALSTSQRAELKTIAGTHGADSAQVTAYLKSALGPEYQRIMQSVGANVLSLYEKAEKEVLSHSKFATAPIAEQVRGISTRFGELLRSQYKIIFETLDNDILNSIMVSIKVPLEEAKTTILEAARKNALARIPNLVSSAQESANVIIAAFEQLVARIRAASIEIAATTARGAIGMPMPTRLGRMANAGTISRGPFMLNTGGKITGPGGPKDDVIPAMLSDGEYVIKASSVAKYGTGFMDAINAGKYATGGLVKGYEDGSLISKTINNIKFNSSQLEAGMLDSMGLKWLEKMIAEGAFNSGFERSHKVGQGILSGISGAGKWASGWHYISPSTHNQLLGQLYRVYKNKKFQGAFTGYNNVIRMMKTNGDIVSYQDAKELLKFLNSGRLDGIVERSKDIKGQWHSFSTRGGTTSGRISESKAWLSSLIEGGEAKFNAKMSLLTGISTMSRSRNLASTQSGFSRFMSIFENTPKKFVGFRGIRAVAANGGLVRGFNAGGMEGSFIPYPEIDGVKVTPFIEANLKKALQSPMYKERMSKILQTPGEFAKWVARLEEAFLTYRPKQWARQAEFFDPYRMTTPQEQARLDQSLMLNAKRSLEHEQTRKRIEAQIAEGVRPRYYTDILGNDTPYRKWLAEFGSEEEVARYWKNMGGRRLRFIIPPLASGGKIYGAGGPTDDKIPALLSNGEYVVKADSVAKYGTGFMDALNAGKFANGGIARFAKGTPEQRMNTYLGGKDPILAEKIIGFRSSVQDTLGNFATSLKAGLLNGLNPIKESLATTSTQFKKMAISAQNNFNQLSIFNRPTQVPIGTGSGSNTFTKDQYKSVYQNYKSQYMRQGLTSEEASAQAHQSAQQHIRGITGSQPSSYSTSGVGASEKEYRLQTRNMNRGRISKFFKPNLSPEEMQSRSMRGMGLGMGISMGSMMAAGAIHGQGAGSEAARSGLMSAGMVGGILPMLAPGMGIPGIGAVLAGVAALSVGFTFLSKHLKDVKERALDADAAFKESFTIPKDEAAALGIKLKDLSKVISYAGKDTDKAKTSIDIYAQSILQQAESSDSMKRFLKTIKNAGDDPEKLNKILNDRYQTEIMLGQTMQDATTHVLAFAQVTGTAFNASSLNKMSPVQILLKANKENLGSFVASSLQNPNSSTDQLQTLFKAGGVTQRRDFVPQLIKSLKDVVAPETYTRLMTNEGSISGKNVYRLGSGIEQMQAGFLNESQFVKFMQSDKYATDAMKIFAQRQTDITNINSDIQKQINKLSGVTNLEDQKSAKEKLIKTHENEIKVNNKKISQEQKMMEARNKEYEALNKSIEQQQEINQLNADVSKAKAGGNLIDIAMAEQARISGLSKIDRERAKDAADAKNQAVIEKLTNKNETLTTSIDNLNTQIQAIDEKIAKGVGTGNKKVEEAIINLQNIQQAASIDAFTPEAFRNWQKQNPLQKLGEFPSIDAYLRSLGISTSGVNTKAISAVIGGRTAPTATALSGTAESKKIQYYMYIDESYQQQYVAQKGGVWYPAQYSTANNRLYIAQGAKPLSNTIISKIKNTLTPWQNKADGGYISGPGGPTSDSIPVRLSNGEYVVKADSVNKYGTEFLDSVNAGKYAEGGIVKEDTSPLDKILKNPPSKFSGRNYPRPANPMTNDSSYLNKAYQIYKKIPYSESKMGLSTGLGCSPFTSFLYSLFGYDISGNANQQARLKNGSLDILNAKNLKSGDLILIAFPAFKKVDEKEINESINDYLKMMNKINRSNKSEVSKKHWTEYYSRRIENLKSRLKKGYEVDPYELPMGVNLDSLKNIKDEFDSNSFFHAKTWKPYIMSDPYSKRKDKSGNYISTWLDPNAKKEKGWKRFKDKSRRFKDYEFHHSAIISKVFNSSMNRHSLASLIEAGTDGHMEDVGAWIGEQQWNNSPLVFDDGTIANFLAVKRFFGTSYPRKKIDPNNYPKGTVKFADGGHITGPGSTTSDSIPAMLSNGEYVVRASSVAKYGADFMNSINEGKYGFAMGGLVPSKFYVPSMNTSVAKFAEGGLVDGGSYNINITVNASTMSSADEIASAIKKEFGKIEIKKQMMSTSRTVTV